MELVVLEWETEFLVREGGQKGKRAQKGLFSGDARRTVLAALMWT